VTVTPGSLTIQFTSPTTGTLTLPKGNSISIQVRVLMSDIRKHRRLLRVGNCHGKMRPELDITRLDVKCQN